MMPFCICIYTHTHTHTHTHSLSHTHAHLWAQFHRLQLRHKTHTASLKHWSMFLDSHHLVPHPRSREPAAHRHGNSGQLPWFLWKSMMLLLPPADRLFLLLLLTLSVSLSSLCLSLSLSPQHLSPPRCPPPLFFFSLYPSFIIFSSVSSAFLSSPLPLLHSSRL